MSLHCYLKSLGLGVRLLFKNRKISQKKKPNKGLKKLLKHTETLVPGEQSSLSQKIFTTKIVHIQRAYANVSREPDGYRCNEMLTGQSEYSLSTHILLLLPLLYLLVLPWPPVGNVISQSNRRNKGYCVSHWKS